MAHKSTGNRIVLPDMGAMNISRKYRIKEKSPKKNPSKVDRAHSTGAITSDRLFTELEKTGKALKAIEEAIHANTNALRAQEIGRPTVVVRTERA